MQGDTCSCARVYFMQHLDISERLERGLTLQACQNSVVMTLLRLCIATLLRERMRSVASR